MMGNNLISTELFDALITQAGTNPRRRINHNLHDSYKDCVQRFLNVIDFTSYVRPHSHMQENAWEGFIILRGRLAVIQFSDEGIVEERIILSEDGPEVGIEINSNNPHSITSLSEHAVVFEYKPGPYDPGLDKRFYDWAPDENDNAAQLFNKWMKNAGAGENYWSGKQ